MSRRRPTNPAAARHHEQMRQARDAADQLLAKPVEGVPGDDVLTACVALIPRLGASAFESRYSDDDNPTVWMAIAHFPTGAVEVDAALSPQRAAWRLAERLVDGGHCLHCHRPTGITLELAEQLAPQLICWYQYDPELKRFRRSCEGD